MSGGMILSCLLVSRAFQHTVKLLLGLIGSQPDLSSCAQSVFCNHGLTRLSFTVVMITTCFDTYAGMHALLPACETRSQGLDHFLWLTGDRGACDWPAEEDPALANVIKVVHFGWHHAGNKFGEPKGWEGLIKNKVRMFLRL